MTTCKNCGCNFTGKYCNNCSQPADTGRLNFKSVWHDLRGSLLRFNDQLPFTTKELFLRPGYSIREYIEGKRIKHFKPFSYLLLVAGTYALLNNYFHTQLTDDTSELHLEKVGISDFNVWLMSHYAIVSLSIVPLYALFSYLLLRKEDYNFIEHLVISCYLGAQRILFSFLFFPLIYLTYHTPYLPYVRNIISIIGMALMYWSYTQIFSKLSKLKLFFVVLGIYLLVLSLVTGVIIAILYI